MYLIDNAEGIPDDRVLDGVDQTSWLSGEKDEPERDHFHMFFGMTHVGMRYKNFKVLTHRVEDGAAPVQQLATPHIFNLTVNPDEDTPYNYGQVHPWVLYRRFIPMAGEFQKSLAKDSVPPKAPLDYNPYSAGQEED